MDYCCPNGHKVPLIEMVNCEADGCEAMTAYEPSAYGAEIHAELREANRLQEDMRHERDEYRLRWEILGRVASSRVDRITRFAEAKERTIVDLQTHLTEVRALLALYETYAPPDLQRLVTYEHEIAKLR
jgi:hypothetical protein